MPPSAGRPPLKHLVKHKGAPISMPFCGLIAPAPGIPELQSEPRCLAGEGCGAAPPKVAALGPGLH